MLSIFSPHFFNWTEQLRDSGHQVYWLDIFDSNTQVEQIDFVEQIIGWRYKRNYPGRYFLKKNAPVITKLINIFNERNFQKQLEKQIRRIKPDVVHSFVMYLAGVPALAVMKKFPEIKWIYTAWGSDMFYYQNQFEDFAGMKAALPQMDYMFADCQRDYNIAQEHGFEGRFLGVFPGGGGFDFESCDSLILSPENRKIILIKGYQGLHGKCISVLKAILILEEKLNSYRIVVFGATPEVFKFGETPSVKEFKNLEIYGKLTHHNLMELMGQAFIYIGNSNSDGMPNTLLEAIIMGAFPLQSNPGGATEEIITDGKNGFLIQDPESSEDIANIIMKTLNAPKLINEGVEYNNKYVKPELERKKVQEQVLEKYKLIERELNS